MENASKALIIAGAILIAILLISVGVMVMNSINDPIDQSVDQAQAQAIEMFNAKFTGYAGNDQKAASIKALITSIQSSNGVNAQHKINFISSDYATSLSEMQTNVNNQKSYTVLFQYTDGYITGVTINDN